MTGQAGSAKVTTQEVVKTGGKSVTIDGSGVTALAGNGANASASKGRFTMRAAGQSVEMRVIGTTLYEKVPPGADRQKLSGGKPWIKIDTAEVGSSLAGTDQAPDAGAQLGYLRSAQHATEVGTEKIDGVATTHYRTTVPTSALKTPGVKADKPMTIDVWIDAQHRVRQEKVTLDFTATGSGSSGTSGTSGSTATGGSGTAQSGSLAMLTRLTDFGTPVQVTAPPSSQTADATQKVTAGQSGGTTDAG